MSRCSALSSISPPRLTTLGTASSRATHLLVDDVRLSGGAEMTAKEVSEVVKKIDPDTVAYREQYKAELINMMKEKEAKAAKKAAEEAKKKGDDDDDDDRVSRALRT